MGQVKLPVTTDETLANDLEVIRNSWGTYIAAELADARVRRITQGTSSTPTPAEELCASYVMRHTMEAVINAVEAYLTRQQPQDTPKTPPKTPPKKRVRNTASALVGGGAPSIQLDTALEDLRATLRRASIPFQRVAGA